MPGNTSRSRARSSGAIKQRRSALPWPEQSEFRILSIDGGGIRGIFPAVILSGLEQRYLGGRSIAEYFDLVAGTSTGGILATALGAGLTATEVSRVYLERGNEIFPPVKRGWLSGAKQRVRGFRQFFKYRYDRTALERILREKMGDTTLRESRCRLCIPAFEGVHGDVYIFKTPHHPDFFLDANEPMSKIAAATAAAPTFYSPLEEGGYVYVDGGIWANNPAMIALVDALSCFDVARDSVRVLSLGCGDEMCTVSQYQITWGGIWAWRKVIKAAMRLQSLNSIGQAGLLLGPSNFLRIDVASSEQPIELDDWRRARIELPGPAETALDRFGVRIREEFFYDPAAPFKSFH